MNDILMYHPICGSNFRDDDFSYPIFTKCGGKFASNITYHIVGSEDYQ